MPEADLMSSAPWRQGSDSIFIAATIEVFGNVPA
jgi:hypothetical protein